MPRPLCPPPHVPVPHRAQESELLLPPKMVFEIQGVFPSGNGLTFVQMQEMPMDDVIVDLDAGAPATATSARDLGSPPLGSLSGSFAGSFPSGVPAPPLNLGSFGMENVSPQASVYVNVTVVKPP